MLLTITTASPTAIDADVSITSTGLYLTVSDLGVAVSVRCEDASQCSDAGGVLKGGMVRQRAVKVSLNLLCGQAAVTHRLLHQAGVITLMRLELGGCVCTNQR